MISHLALLWVFFLFMWEFQANSAWNVRCVFKMMHLILKRTSQDKIDHSLENGAHLSIWAATVLPVLFFFYSLKKKPLLVCTWEPQVMWFHFQGSFWWDDRLQESRHTASADAVGSVFAERLRLLACTLIFGPLLRWWAETGGVEPFGNDFRDDQPRQDQVNLGHCARFMVTFHWNVITVWSRCPCRLWSTCSSFLLWYR